MRSAIGVGTSGCCTEMRGEPSVSRFASIAAGAESAKGRDPASISYSTAPSA